MLFLLSVSSSQTRPRGASVARRVHVVLIVDARRGTPGAAPGSSVLRPALGEDGAPTSFTSRYRLLMSRTSTSQSTPRRRRRPTRAAPLFTTGIWGMHEPRAVGERRRDAVARLGVFAIFRRVAVVHAARVVAACFVCGTTSSRTTSTAARRAGRALDAARGGGEDRPARSRARRALQRAGRPARGPGEPPSRVAGASRRRRSPRTTRRPSRRRWTRARWRRRRELRRRARHAGADGVAHEKLRRRTRRVQLDPATSRWSGKDRGRRGRAAEISPRAAVGSAERRRCSSAAEWSAHIARRARMHSRVAATRRRPPSRPRTSRWSNPTPERVRYHAHLRARSPPEPGRALSRTARGRSPGGGAAGVDRRRGCESARLHAGRRAAAIADPCSEPYGVKGVVSRRRRKTGVGGAARAEAREAVGGLADARDVARRWRRCRRGCRRRRARRAGSRARVDGVHGFEPQRGRRRAHRGEAAAAAAVARSSPQKTPPGAGGPSAARRRRRCGRRPRLVALLLPRMSMLKKRALLHGSASKIQQIWRRSGRGGNFAAKAATILLSWAPYWDIGGDDAGPSIIDTDVRRARARARNPRPALPARAPAAPLATLTAAPPALRRADANRRVDARAQAGGRDRQARDAREKGRHHKGDGGGDGRGSGRWSPTPKRLAGRRSSRSAEAAAGRRPSASASARAR